MVSLDIVIPIPSVTTQLYKNIDADLMSKPEATMTRNNSL